MVEEFRIGDSELAADPPEAQIPGPEDEPRDARGHRRSGAHDTRFQRHVQRSPFQTIVLRRFGGLPQRQDFRMGGGIVTGDR